MRTENTTEITAAPKTGVVSILRACVGSFVVLTAITGLVYPLIVTAAAKTVFKNQAEGSLIDKDGKPTNDADKAVGSRLIGQVFDQPYYFWSRPSATGPMGYNASASTGSNKGPSANADPVNGPVKGYVDALKAADPNNTLPVPIDLVTASGSGLDPEESVAAAMYQAGRVASARHMTAAAVEGLVKEHTHAPMLGVLGEQTVNVLELNLALDAMAPMPATAAATTAATQP